MADFLTAYRLVLGIEGGYVDHPADRGSETYKGVSRRWHPSWPGWRRIDSFKGKPNWQKQLDQDLWLQGQVEQFYRSQFYDRIGGDEIADQALVNELFDIAVNLDPTRAVTFLQRAITALWRHVPPSADDTLLGRDVNTPVTIDGRFGSQTADALTACLAADPRNEAALLTLLNVQQGAHYLDQLLTYPRQRAFALGWLTRVKL